MVHSSVCRAPTTIAIIVFVSCCIERVEGHWLIVTGAIIVIIVFTVAVVGVIFAIILVEVVFLMGVGGCGSRCCRDHLHRRCCRCCLRNHLCGSLRLIVLTEVVVLMGVRGRSCDCLHCHHCKCHLHN